MTDFEKARSLSLEQCALWYLDVHVGALLSFYSAETEGNTGAYLPNFLDINTSKIERALSAISDRGFVNDIKSLLNKYRDDLPERDDTKKCIKELIRTRIERLNPELASIEASFEKAEGYLMGVIDYGDFDTDQVYDAIVYFYGKGMIADPLIREIVVAWKQEEKAFVETIKEDPFARRGIFWTSWDNMETMDCISRYRFLEVLGIGGFDDTVFAIEKELALTLKYGEGPDVAHEVWLASRSSMLCSRIRPFLDVILNGIANTQLDEGWWPDPVLSAGRERDYVGEDGVYDLKKIAMAKPEHFRVPHIGLTTKCVLILLKLCRQDWQFDIAVKGVKWLINQQHREGYWPLIKWTYANPDASDEEKPSLVATLLALESIRLSGLTGMEHYLKMGEDWILSQQLSDGVWDAAPKTFPFSTVLILEYFSQVPHAPTRLLGLLGIAKYFISRGREFYFEHNANAHRLAIVTAHQGLEVFLYACLSHPSVDIDIFESRRRTRTIGVRRALDKLREHSGEDLKWGSSMYDLANRRDDIVHKAGSVLPDRCKELVEDTIKFTNKYCAEIFSHGLV